MKKSRIIAVVAAIMVMASSTFCFAGTDSLELKSSYPENGQKNTSIENVGVQLHFNKPVNSEAAKKADEKLVKIVDEDGKAIKTKVLFSDKNDGLVLVVADNADKKVKISNSETYTLVIDKDFVDNEGNTIGEKTTVEFTTYNQKLNNFINMAMMFVMFGGVMVVTLKQQRDQAAEKANPKEEKEVAFNPYREAKKTGKTVEEVMAEEAKRQEKANKKKKHKKKAAEDVKHVKIERCSDYLNNVYHVHAPQSLKKRKAAPANKGGKR